MSECVKQDEKLKNDDVKVLNSAAELIKAANIPSCKTNDFTLNFAMQAAGLVGIPFGTGMNFTVNKSSTLGCENLMVLSKKYRETVNQINCLITKKANSMNKRNIAFNKITFLAENGAEIIQTCDSFKINQRIDLKDITDIEFNNTEKNEIKNTVLTFLNDSKGIFQKNLAEIGSTEKGNKYYEDIDMAYNKLQTNIDIDETINNIKITNGGYGEIIFTSSDEGTKLEIYGKDCELNQNILIDIYTKAIINNTINKAFKNLSKTITEIEREIEQKSEGKGLNTLLDNFWGSFKDTMTTFYIVFVIIAIIFIVVAGIFIFKAKDTEAGQALIEKGIGK